MDFAFTDEQELVRENIKAWCAQHVTEEKVRDWYANHGIPAEISKAWIDSGFGFLGLPEEHGGTPCDLTTLGLVAETLCAETGARLPFVTNMIDIFDMIEFGSPEQIKLCMDAFKSTGKTLFSPAFSEPGAGSDSMSMTTYAKEIDGKFHINGTKNWVTGGEDADYVLLIAKDDDPAPTNSSMSLWLVPLDSPGLTTHLTDKIGGHIAPFCDMYFDDVVVDESARVGKRGEGFMNLMRDFEMHRCVAIAGNLGLAQAAMDDAAMYANERVQFGKPIGTFQLIQEKLTDMEIKLRNTRNLLYQTLWKMDTGQSVQLDSALMKRYGAEATTEVCNEALQIFGGLGYTNDVRVGRLFLECRGYTIAGGTSEVMVYIAGRMITKSYAKRAK